MCIRDSISDDSPKYTVLEVGQEKAQNDIGGVQIFVVPSNKEPNDSEV